MEIERESTEYIYIGVTGDVPSVGAEVAFLTAGSRPTAPDWNTAIIVDDAGDALWPDAQAAGVSGDYFVAILVGPENSGIDLSAGAPADYQVWVKLTDTTEVPVKVAPAAVEVQ